MATKTTLKSYFETGDSPTQAQFSILIDSLLGIDEEVADNLTTDSGVQALAARQGVALKAVVDALGIRVGSIEELNSTTLNDYLLKADLGGYLVGKSDTNHTHLASSITDLLDLVYTKAQVQDLVDNHASSAHTHQISEVAGLQTALDNANDSSLVAQAKSELETSISGKADLSHGHTESEISDLKNYIESATATLLLQGKSDIGHTHSESSISDLDKYTKAEVDSLFAGVVSDGSVPAHTHTEANISDLDKYSKAEADQKIEDGKTTMLVAHLAESNPHNITKADVGLGNVDNLSKVSLFTDPTLSGNINLSGAITGLTKNSVSLGNVPNVDAQALLQAHLNDEDNPHKVALSDFDTYSRAQTDSQIQTLVEIYRTVHTGDMPSSYEDFNGTGSTGLITQKDIWEKIKDIKYDASTGTTQVEGNLTTTNNVSIGGTLDVSTAFLGEITVSSEGISSLKDLRLTSSTGEVEVDDDLSVNNTLKVKDLFTAPLVNIGEVKEFEDSKDYEIRNIIKESGDNFKFTESYYGLSNSGEPIPDNGWVRGATSGVYYKNTSGGVLNTDPEVDPTGWTSSGFSTLYNLAQAGMLVEEYSILHKIIGPVSIGGSVSIGGGLNVTGSTNFLGNVEIGDSSDSSPPGLTVYGDLTVKGETTSIATTNLEVHDNIIKLNSNVTGSPTLDSGFEVERGNEEDAKLYWSESDDKWKFSDGTSTGTIASNEDLTAFKNLVNNPHSVTKTQVGLGNVEDTALSTWAGSGQITNLGTIVSGTVPVARVNGLHAVATSGQYTDIEGTPTTATLLANITAVEGVPTSSASYNASTLKFSIPRGSQITGVTSSSIASTATATATLSKDTNGDYSIAFGIPAVDSSSQIAWSQLTSGVPTTFAPSSHSHAWSTITGLPATFAPSSHSHAYTSITGAPTFAYNSTTKTLTITT